MNASARVTHLLGEVIRNRDLQDPIRNAILALQHSHLIVLLREFAKPVPHDPTNINYLVLEAQENKRVFGYNQCLDDIQYFFERYVTPLSVPMTDSQTSMYLAEIDKLVGNGTLTKEEADKLKEQHGKQSKLN